MLKATQLHILSQFDYNDKTNQEIVEDIFDF